MKLYALTSIEADDKDQRLCGGCDACRSDRVGRFCLKYGKWLSANDRYLPQRCPACLAATAIHPLIEAVSRHYENRITENWCIQDELAKFRAAWNLKGKLK